MKQRFYIGIWAVGYGQKEGGGLAVLSQQPDGTLKIDQRIDTGGGVSSILVDDKNNLLYAISEMNEGSAEGIGGDILTFRINNDGSLEKGCVQSSMGAFPIEMVLIDGFAVVVNHGSTTNKIVKTKKGQDGTIQMYYDYDEASAVLFELRPDNILGSLSDLYVFEGSGPIAPAQNSASPHSISLSPNKELIVVPERGTDSFSVFRLNKTEKKLQLVNQVSSRKKAGARNIAFHPSKPFIYLINEIEPLLQIFRYDNTGKNITETGSIPTISEEYRISGKDSRISPVAIRLHLSGKYLYVLTRGTNTITTFEVKEDGLLDLIDIQSVLGEHPREMVFTEDCQSLYVANLGSGSVTRFSIDAQTGKPSNGTVVIDGIKNLATITK